MLPVHRARERASRKAGDIDMVVTVSSTGIATPSLEARVARRLGLRADVVRVLCRYGFRVRGLHRLQLETLADNHAMIAVAEKLGFTREGATRGSSWVNGRFMDDVIFGLMDDEFNG